MNQLALHARRELLLPFARNTEVSGEIFLSVWPGCVGDSAIEKTIPVRIPHTLNLNDSGRPPARMAQNTGAVRMGVIGRAIGFVLLTSLAVLGAGPAGFGQEVPQQQPKAVVVTPSELVNQRFEATRQDPKSNAQCGVNCLYLFLKAVEPKTRISLQDVRQHVPVTAQGSTLAQLKAGAESLGLKVRAVQCPTSKLEQLPLPAVALIEPNNLENFVTHYVLLVRVTPLTVTYIDPTFGEVQYDRSDYSRWATGYYLIAGGRSFSGFYFLIFAVGCVLLGAALLDGRSIRRLFGAGRAGASRIAPTAMLLVPLFGSGCLKPEAPIQSYGPPRSLEFDGPLNRHLGLIKPRSDTNTTFQFQSARDAKIKLSVGQPSCGCLNVALSPKEELMPGGIGTVRMALKTSESSGGPVEGMVALGIEDESETYQLSLAAFVEGVVGGKYVVRPHQLRRGKLPDLVLVAYTENADVPVVVTDIIARDPFTKQVFDQIQTRVNEAKAGEPRSYPDSGCQREIKIPVTVPAGTSPVEGEFAVKYRLRDEEREAIVPLYVLADGS